MDWVLFDDSVTVTLMRIMDVSDLTCFTGDLFTVNVVI